MDRRLTPRGAERRTQLMDFAIARFAENGYHPTSVAEITSGLGVGKGVFYWYFSSKDELFTEILRTAQRNLRLAQTEAVGSETDPVRRIELGIRASLTWSAQHRDVFTLFQFARTDDRFSGLVSRGQQKALRIVGGQVAEAMAQGTVRPADPELVAHAVLGVTTHLAREYIHARGMAASDVADATVAFVLHGVLNPSLGDTDGVSGGRGSDVSPGG